MKTPSLSLKTSPKLSKHSQRGDALIVGIICMSVLILVAIGFFILIASQKPKPILTVNQPKISADDDLTAGKSNNELVQDGMILTAGNKRDGDEQAAAQKVLSDQPQAVGTPAGSSPATGATTP